jgi:hypothetical protein
VDHALHIAAVTQIRNNTRGREYYRRKLAEGKKDHVGALPSQAAKARKGPGTRAVKPRVLAERSHRRSVVHGFAHARRGERPLRIRRTPAPSVLGIGEQKRGDVVTFTWLT